MIKYRILGLLLLFFVSISIKEDFQELIVLTKGHLMTVDVINKYKGGGHFPYYIVEFNYRGKMFDVKVSKSKYYNIENGQSIQVLHKYGIDYFVVPEKKIGVSIIPAIIFFFAGLFFLFYNPRKK